MIEFERAKNLAKNKKMSLREVNDKAKLGTNSFRKLKLLTSDTDIIGYLF